MSEPCHDLRPVFSRVVEREASPDDALRLARHIPDCTACRILLAREVHLARVLDALDDSIPVEEGFLESVMRSLPHGPPPAPRRKGHGLKVAGLAAALLGGGAVARLAILLAGGRLATLSPRVDVADTEHFLEALAGIARVAWMVLDRASANLAPDLPALHFYARTGLAAVILGAAAVLTLSTFVALLARARLRD